MPNRKNRKANEGSIYKVKGRDMFRGVVRVDGVARTVSAKTMTEATQKLKDLINHIDSGVDVEASNMNLEA